MRITTLLQQNDPVAMRLRWVQAEAAQVQQWHHLLQPGSLHLVMNATGRGMVIAPAVRLTLIPGTLAQFALPPHCPQLSATRMACEDAHEFLLINLEFSTLRRLFLGQEKELREASLSPIRRWTERDRQLYEDLTNPPIPPPAQQTWRTAKLLELLTLHFFHRQSCNAPLFCSLLKEKTHRHVRRALELLDAQLTEPLDLADLASDVGCAPHYLSRLVKQETGKTLSLHLRAFRIQKACELLSAQKFNVTEVGLEVGYQSLSHFTKAFSAEKGMTPSRYLKGDDLNSAQGNGN